MTLLPLFIALVFIHGIFAKKLRGTVLTEPILFTTAGILTALFDPATAGRESSREMYLSVAEIGLVLLLFTDASRTDLRMLKSIRNLPERLLGPGLLLTILLGSLAAVFVIPGLTIWEGAILGAILAPTDAGLGQVIVNSKKIPAKIREALNVEAGLNDGLSVPFLLFFMALAASAGGPREASLYRFVLEQLGFGVLTGLVIGLAGGWLLGLAARKGWTDPAWQQLSVVALALLCIPAAERVSASMFIAAFVAGLAVQPGFRHAAKHSTGFAEDCGRLLNLFVFFLFGNIAAASLGEIQFVHGLYALLSLTVIRMLPVAAALAGSGLASGTVAFVGWFGPRGLASIVLGLVFIEEELSLPGEDPIRLAVTATVLLSIFAHGLSAKPGIALYEKFLRRLPANAPEKEARQTPPAPG